MSFNPKVSVVIPVYKGADYVGEAIESVVAQTYKNIEIIVVDDGSPDDGATRRAVERYVPRVRYVHQENRGVAGALNTGVREMTGDIFSWLSHDDLFVQDKTAKQIAFMEALGRDDVVIYSDYTNVDPNNKTLYDVEMDRKMLADQPLLAVLRGCLNGCTMLIPRKVFDVVGLFDERLRFTQDYDYWDRVEDHFSLVHCPGKVVRQRLHPGQDSHKPAALDECNALWLRLIDKRGHAKRTMIAGSSQRFLEGMRKFIALTPYNDALAGIDDRITRCVAETKVSVVLDVSGDRDGAERALASVVSQSHSNVEVVIVERAEGAADLSLLPWAKARAPITVLAAHGANRSVARNLALGHCTGGYIAFLGDDDAFMPNKIEMQMAAMQREGALISHTSYYVSCPEAGAGHAHVAAGALSGKLYPELIGACPVRVETLMINSLLVAEGFRFDGDDESDETLTLIKLAQQHDFLGLPDSLGIHRWSLDRAPLNLDRAIASLAKLQLALECDPVAGVEREALQRLDARFHQLKEQMRQARGQEPRAAAFNAGLLQHLLAADAVLVDAHGPA